MDQQLDQNDMDHQLDHIEEINSIENIQHTQIYPDPEPRPQNEQEEHNKLSFNYEQIIKRQKRPQSSVGYRKPRQLQMKQGLGQLQTIGYQTFSTRSGRLKNKREKQLFKKFSKTAKGKKDKDGIKFLIFKEQNRLACKFLMNYGQFCQATLKKGRTSHYTKSRKKQKKYAATVNLPVVKKVKQLSEIQHRKIQKVMKNPNIDLKNLFPRSRSIKTQRIKLDAKFAPKLLGYYKDLSAMDQRRFEFTRKPIPALNPVKYRDEKVYIQNFIFLIYNKSRVLIEKNYNLIKILETMTYQENLDQQQFNSIKQKTITDISNMIQNEYKQLKTTIAAGQKNKAFIQSKKFTKLMKKLTPMLKQVYLEYELLCLVFQIEIYYESHEENCEKEINAFKLYEKYFQEEKSVKELIRKQFLDLRKKTRFLEKLLPKRQRRENFVLRYTNRHKHKIEELLRWNHILEVYDKLCKTGKKIQYELEADLIDYTESLKDFLVAVDKYSTVWPFEKFKNFGYLIEQKYKKMIRNGFIMKRNLFEKFYYKCDKKIRENKAFLLKFSKSKSNPQYIEQSVVRDQQLLKVLQLTEDYLKRIPYHGIKHQIFKRQRKFTEQFIDLKAIFLAYQQVFFLTEHLEDGEGHTYKKILRILKLLNQFLLKQEEMINQMILTKFHFCPYQHQLLKQYPELNKKVQKWVKSIMKAKKTNFATLKDDLKSTQNVIKKFFLEWSLVITEKDVDKFKDKMEEISLQLNNMINIEYEELIQDAEFPKEKIDKILIYCEVIWQLLPSIKMYLRSVKIYSGYQFSLMDKQFKNTIIVCQKEIEKATRKFENDQDSVNKILYQKMSEKIGPEVTIPFLIENQKLKDTLDMLQKLAKNLENFYPEKLYLIDKEISSIIYKRKYVCKLNSENYDLIVDFKQMQSSLDQKMNLLNEFFKNNLFFLLYKKNYLSKFLIFKWDLFEEQQKELQDIIIDCNLESWKQFIIVILTVLIKISHNDGYYYEDDQEVDIYSQKEIIKKLAEGEEKKQENDKKKNKKDGKFLKMIINKNKKKWKEQKDYLEQVQRQTDYLEEDNIKGFDSLFTHFIQNVITTSMMKFNFKHYHDLKGHFTKFIDQDFCNEKQQTDQYINHLRILCIDSEKQLRVKIKKHKLNENKKYFKDLNLQCECIHQEFIFMNNIFKNITKIFGVREDQNYIDKTCEHYQILQLILVVQKEIIMTDKPFATILEKKYFKHFKSILANMKQHLGDPTTGAIAKLTIEKRKINDYYFPAEMDQQYVNNEILSKKVQTVFEDIIWIIDELLKTINSMAYQQIRIFEEFGDIQKEMDREWTFMFYVKLYLRRMKENVVFVYPTSQIIRYTKMNRDIQLKEKKAQLLSFQKRQCQYIPYIMFYGDIVDCTTIDLFKIFKENFFKSYYKMMEHSFTKGLEHCQLQVQHIIDGKGPLDLFLFNCENKKQNVVFKGSNISRPPDNKHHFKITIIKSFGHSSISSTIESRTLEETRILQEQKAKLDEEISHYKRIPENERKEEMIIPVQEISLGRYSLEDTEVFWPWKFYTIIELEGCYPTVIKNIASVCFIKQKGIKPKLNVSIQTTHYVNELNLLNENMVIYPQLADNEHIRIYMQIQKKSNLMLDESDDEKDEIERPLKIDVKIVCSKGKEEEKKRTINSFRQALKLQLLPSEMPKKNGSDKKRKVHKDLLIQKPQEQKVQAKLQLFQVEDLDFPPNSTIDISIQSVHHNFTQVQGSYFLYFQNKEKSRNDYKICYESRSSELQQWKILEIQAVEGVDQYASLNRSNLGGISLQRMDVNIKNQFELAQFVRKEKK